jgi:tungstate transport system ATP-binding protein
MSPLLEMAVRHQVGEFTIDAQLCAAAGPLVVIGPSGAGKTILLKILAGIVRPGEGRIALNGRVFSDSASGMFMHPKDRRVGYVPQDYALFPHLTVRGNISFGLQGLGHSESVSRVESLLNLVGLRDLGDARPKQLSGGQRQRVALARALAVNPEMLLFDEPFAAIDVPTRQTLMDDLQRLLAETNTDAIMVTHDRNEALRLAECVSVLMAGKVLQTGTPAQVFGSPVSEEVAAFVGVETIVAGRVSGIEQGVPVVEVAGHSIEGGADAIRGDNVLVCLRPEDVTLSIDTQTSSARNHIPARVVRIIPSGPYVRVELDAGFRLVSLVTARAVDELSLRPGKEVVASFKASAVHLIRK